MTRYPHLPPALLGLLEPGPLTVIGLQSESRTYVWQGTPTELYSALEPHRVDPWPANPVSLSLWLKHHAREHGIQVDFHHTGERRVLRLARGSNGLGGEGISQHSGTKSGHSETKSAHSGPFWSFPTWGALLEGLPAVFDSHPSEITFTLAYRYPNWQSARVVTRFFLESEAVGVSLHFPQVLEVRIYPAEVDIVTVWPMGE